MALCRMCAAGSAATVHTDERGSQGPVPALGTHDLRRAASGPARMGNLRAHAHLQACLELDKGL